MPTIKKRTLKNGQTVFEIQVKATDIGSGRSIRKSITWRPEEGMSAKKAEREAVIAADKFEKEIQASISGCSTVEEPTTITFREFSLKWLERTKRDCSLSYYVKSKEHLEYTYQFIGGFKLRELSPSIIQNFFDKIDERRKKVIHIKPKPLLRKKLKSYGITKKFLRFRNISLKILNRAIEGGNVSEEWANALCEATNIPFSELFEKQVSEEPYAWETNTQFKRTVRCVLALAKKNRLIQDNWASADYINYPKKRTKPINVLDDEEATKLYEALSSWKDIRQKTAIFICLLTGFRRGEIAGLEWKDIDFVNKTITIERSVIFVKGYGLIEKCPKSESSNRKIGIPTTLVEILKEYREYWLKLREICGDYIKPSDKLFTKERGDLLNPSILLHWFNLILKSVGIEHHTLHSLRHTNITLQLIAGVPLVTVSARAGHSKASTTSDIYSHFLQTSDKQAAEMLDELFKTKLKKD